MNIIIFCDRPGYIRGGVRHPAAQVYAATEFKPEQLREICGDGRLKVYWAYDAVAGDIDGMICGDQRVAANTKPATGTAKPRAKGGK